MTAQTASRPGFMQGIPGARPLTFLRQPQATRPGVAKPAPVQPQPALRAAAPAPKPEAARGVDAPHNQKSRLTPRQREAVGGIIAQGGSVTEDRAMELGLDGRILRSLVRTRMLDLTDCRYAVTPAARELSSSPAVVGRSEEGAVSAAEFRARSEGLFAARRGWKRMLAGALGVSEQTVSKWLAGTLPVPEYVVAVLECLEALRAAGRIMPPRFQLGR